MPWPVSPLAGKTTDWRAVCGRSARPVRREGASKPIGASYPYHALLAELSKKDVDARDKRGHDGGRVIRPHRNVL
jgi:hypothetical protein